MKLMQELFKMIPRGRIDEASSPKQPWQIRLRLDGDDKIVAASVAPADLNATLDKLAKKYKIDKSEFEMFRHGTQSWSEANK